MPAPPKLVRKPAVKQKQVLLIDHVEFRGNRRYPSSVLLARISERAGQVYDVNNVERDLMALWNTGYFDNIRTVRETGAHGAIVIFYVDEKRLVRSMKFVGLNSVSQSDVMDAWQQQHVNLTIMSLYDPVVVRAAEVVVQEMLSSVGRQDATVSHSTRSIPPDSVALTFIVHEGPKVKIGSITFEGNKAIPSRRLLAVMKNSKPYGVPGVMSVLHRTYDRDKLEMDLEKVRELYRSKGYFFMTPGEPIIHTVTTHRTLPVGHGVGKKVNITIPISQGSQYRLGRLTFRGNHLFKESVLRAVLGMKTGDIFDTSKVRKAMKAYSQLYGAYGYINFTTNPEFDPDRKKHIVNLALNFNEDKQFIIHRINFSGNTKTRDYVIRRQLLVDEGAPFNTAMWKMSVYRINQLGYFSPIKIATEDNGEQNGYTVVQHPSQTPPNVDIDVPLKEKGRNSIGFSGGVSGYEGDFLSANYATPNFLGLGDTLSIGGSLGTFMTSANIGFTEPYMFHKPITGGITLFVSDYHFDELQEYGALYGVNLKNLTNTLFGQTYFQNYQTNQKGFTVFAQYPFKRSFARMGITYGYTYSDLETFSSASESLFEALDYGSFAGPSQLHGIQQSMVTPMYEYDNVDNPVFPHRGKMITAQIGFSGSILGGNVNEIAPTLEMKYYHPVNNGRNVLAFHFEAATITGYDGKVPPPYARIYLGGQYTIRGFNFYSISPVVFFPTVGEVCNRNNNGTQIWAVSASGKPEVGTCGSYTQFPYNTVEVPGGDTEALASFEYRIPIISHVVLKYFIDSGDAFILWPDQLSLQPDALSSITDQYPYFKVPTNRLVIAPHLNFTPRVSTGLALDVNLPVIHAPIEVYYGYNAMRLANVYTTPPGPLPPESLFPNMATYDAALPYFERQAFNDPHGMAGFTVGGSW